MHGFHRVWVNCMKLCKNCAFPQQFDTKKLGKILVVYAVEGVTCKHEVTIVWPLICFYYWLYWKTLRKFIPFHSQFISYDFFTIEDFALIRNLVCLYFPFQEWLLVKVHIESVSTGPWKPENLKISWNLEQWLWKPSKSLQLI